MTLGLGEAVGVLFFSDFAPVVEIEGNFNQSCISDIKFLVNASHSFVVFGRRAKAPKCRQVRVLFGDDHRCVVVEMNAFI